MELTLDQALKKGVEAHRAGKLQEADRYYTAILKAQPKHPDANHNMGVLAVGVGKTQEALPFFKIAIETNPSIAQYWLSYIDTLIKLDRMDDAKAIFDQAKNKGAKGDGFDQIEKRLSQFIQIGNNRNNREILDKAIELRENGKYDEAIIFLTDNLNNFPKDPNIIATISHCYILSDNLKEATTYLDIAESIDPDIASVGWNKARLFLKQKKVKEALAVASKTHKLFPNDVEGMNVLSSCLRASGNLGKSLEYLDKAIKLKSDYAEALINRGLISLHQEDKVNALSDLERAHHLKPHIKQIWLPVISLKMEINEFKNVIALAETMIKIETSDEKLYAAIALCHIHLKNYTQAVAFNNKAVSIKPDFCDAWVNLGSALKEQGELDEAIEAYNKALAIKPDYAEAYNNMGAAFQDQGKFDEAVEAFNKAISIKPNFSAAWRNLYYPLQATKMKVNSRLKPNYSSPQIIESTDAKIALDILQYRLSRGQETEETYFENALHTISSAPNLTLQNLKYDKASNNQVSELPEKIIALIHFGRSGTGLLHSLIDGHPEISTLPSIYFSEYFDLSNWEKIISGGREKMVSRFMSIYDVLFDASSVVPVEGMDKKLRCNIGVEEGLANVGNKGDEVLSVDRSIFCSELNRLIDSREEIDALVFFKLVHLAFDKAIKDQNHKNVIFYHIHNPSPNANLNFLRSSPDTKWIMMVREPLQSCESWIKSSFEKAEYANFVNKILNMLFVIDTIINKKQNSIGVRLEDLKKNPKETISTLCSWMGVKEVDSLYEMTAQGKKWWGDPSSQDYSKDGMEPFGRTSINRKVGSIFSENDQFVLSTLFYPFSVRFGYIQENEKKFKANLKKVRPMIDVVFDFEKKILERKQMSFEHFINSGTYMYFRSCLIERWNTLNQFGTYPNMIKPLKI